MTAAAALFLTGGIAYAAWTAMTTNPGNSLQGATLAAPSNVDGTKFAGPATGCTDVTVSWTAAAAPVNTYVVEVRTGNTSWSVLNGDTGAVTSISDTTGYTQKEVYYRVTAGYKSGGGTLTTWASTTISDPSPLLCGSVAEVDDLAAVAGCMSATYTWTLPAGANRFDRQYRINGGAWVTTNDSALTTFAVLTGIAPGDDVEFQVRPEFTATVGSWTPIVAVTNIDCTIENLVSTTTCTGASISYDSPHADTFRYDREYSIDGGAATASNNSAATTWIRNVDGPNVVVRVRGQNSSSTQGSWFTLPAADWGFFMKSVTLSNSGTALALDIGDQVVVEFSRSVAPGTATTTTVWSSNSNPRGLFLAATNDAVANSDLGRIAASNGFWNASGSWAGSVAWNGSRTQWTWTSTDAQAAIMDGGVTGALSLGTSGTRALCDDDGTSPLTNYPTAPSGSF